MLSSRRQALPPVLHTHIPYRLVHMHILTYLHTPNSVSHECVYLPNTLAPASVSLFDHKAEKQRVGQEREKIKEGIRKGPNVFIFQRSIIQGGKMKTTGYEKKILSALYYKESKCSLVFRSLRVVKI